MIDQAHTLVLGDGPGRRAMVSCAPPGSLICVPNAYDGLSVLSRRGFRSVVLAADESQLPGLAKGARRLQPEARILALCPPRSEPRVRPLVGAGLDDYYIAPPTRADVEAILAAGDDSLFDADAKRTISVQHVAALLQAARSQTSLEDHLAGRVAAAVGSAVRWQDGVDTEEALLHLPAWNGCSARSLVPRGHVDLDNAAQTVAALRRLAPELAALARRSDALHRLAITDHLTGAANRRYFYHATDHILASAAESGARVALLLYDIDNFKRYNDTYGHAAGDEILRETAELMRQVTRSHDLVARIGGDEFAVLFWDPETPRQPDSKPPETAEILSRRFLRAVRLHEFRSLGPEATGSLTVSGGIARFPQDGSTCRDLLRSADAGLKTAKRSGKATIRLIGQEQSSS
ncbi:MAG: GGDEF domain-containing protein [Phycisphaerae bacterium]